MDLILWRHAEAHEHPNGLQGLQGDAADLARRLTPRGEQQAARMSAWLDRQLPQTARVLSSPAQRAEQTARALGRKHVVRASLAPGCDARSLLEAAKWPHSPLVTVVVGHQPTLGRVIAGLMGLSTADCPVRKASVWWFRQREREGVVQTVLLTVQVPDLL